ncbi:MAG: hypothetical protein V1775_18945 [Bacteroidota bacterium]
MTLHEAIIQLLKQTGRAMSTHEIADALNRSKWYEKKDRSAITDFQIHGRTRNYPQFFDRNGTMVSLRGMSVSSVKTISPEIKNKTQSLRQVDETTDRGLLLKMLMNEKNFKIAGSIDDKVPDTPGLYCIRISNPDFLPAPFAQHLKERGHNILYIGIATTSLNKRFLGQELRARGHGTFFRGIGAVLGYRPPKGSLKEKKNKNNFTFSSADEKAIIGWINKHLQVNWVTYSGDLENTETLLIKQYLPLLNTAKNPFKLSELEELRKVCRLIANS